MSWCSGKRTERTLPNVFQALADIKWHGNINISTNLDKFLLTSLIWTCAVVYSRNLLSLFLIASRRRYIQFYDHPNSVVSMAISIVTTARGPFIEEIIGERINKIRNSYVFNGQKTTVFIVSNKDFMAAIIICST